MKDPNENRKGYKKTKVGWIPDDWSCEQFSDGFRRVGLEVDVDPSAEYTEIGVRSHGRGLFKKGAIRGKEIGNKRVFWIEGRRLIFNIVFAWEQAVAVTGDDVVGCVGSHRFPMYRARKGWNPKFCAWYFRTARGKYALGIASPGGAGRNRTLGKSELAILCIPKPPLSEAVKISEILEESENLIKKLSDLIQAKKDQKKALMHRLLTGRQRLSQFRGKWKNVRLDNICHRIREVADDPLGYPVLSITSGAGFVCQQDKFSRVIAGRQVENYVRLKKGDFSYNKGNSNRYPQGCVYQLSEFDEGIVPNVFYSFRVDERSVNPEFIRQFFLAGLHNRTLYKWITSGVRSNGLLNLAASDFFSLPIELPGLPEQEAIGKLLRDADNEIDALEEKLRLFRKQNASLTQKLLTGQIRVNA